MAELRKFIKVFLGSPSDLADERRAARALVDDINDELAEALGYQVELVAWEDTLPDMGRPQDVINRDLDGCDLFVGMLWKRWGMPPDVAGPYTSGFEEELSRSIARFERDGVPSIKLLFKDIDSAAMADPGDQLKRTLAFREKTFAERKLLAGSFSDRADFDKKFRKCVIGYINELRLTDSTADPQKGQAPQKDTASTKSNKSSSVDTVVGEDHSASFLKRFAERTDKEHRENPREAMDVARLRLIGTCAEVNGNDTQSLGAHDANLLFRARAEYQFDRREQFGLLDSGLDLSVHENGPLWYWVAAVDGFKGNALVFSTIIGEPVRRVNALNAMRMIGLPLRDREHLTRVQVLNLWLADDNEGIVKVAALNYLGSLGTTLDLPRIETEYKKNDSQTTSSSVSASLQIVVRSDRRHALQLLHDLQPASIDSALLDAIFANDSEFSDDILEQGLTHRSSAVRNKVALILKGRNAVSIQRATTLLLDLDADIRLMALQFLVTCGQTFTLAEAKNILVKPTSSGLLGRASDDAGDAAFERYRRSFALMKSIQQLDAEADSEIFDQNAFFSLARKDYKQRKFALHAAIQDRFASRFVFLLEELTKRIGPGETIENTRALADFMCKGYTREALEIVCEKNDPADIAVVRAAMAHPDLAYSPSDLIYISRFGQWADIPLVIGASQRSSTSRMRSLLSMAFDSEIKYEQAADTILTLGKNRLAEILEIGMPGELLAQVIAKSPGKNFAALTDDQVLLLLRSDVEKIRKRTAVKIAKSFTKPRINKLLAAHMAEKSFFYNVIHWLDFGASCPKEVIKRAVIK